MAIVTVISIIRGYGQDCSPSFWEKHSAVYFIDDRSLLDLDGLRQRSLDAKECLNQLENLNHIAKVYNALAQNSLTIGEPEAVVVSFADSAYKYDPEWFCYTSCKFTAIGPEEFEPYYTVTIAKALVNNGVICDCTQYDESSFNKKDKNLGKDPIELTIELESILFRDQLHRDASNTIPDDQKVIDESNQEEIDRLYETYGLSLIHI